MVAINKGDNTAAFGKDFLRIYLNNPNKLYIQRAVFQINGDMEKEFWEPTFPLRINFTGEETTFLRQVNTCKLALWDANGRRKTADGKFTFLVRENRITQQDAPEMEDDFVELDDSENSLYFDLEDPEFAAQFVMDVSPSKMSELQQDIYLMQPEMIKAGRNVSTFIDEDGNVWIDADMQGVISYNDLEDKPTINGIVMEGDVILPIPEQINADWKATEGPAQILNKPYLAQVAQTGRYADLLEKPKIPTKMSQLEKDIPMVTKDVNDLENYLTVTQTEQEIEASEIRLGEDIANLKRQHNFEIHELESKMEIGLDSKLDKEDYDISGKVDRTEFQIALDEKLDANQLNNGILSIYENDQYLNSFSANSKANIDIRLKRATKLSDLENDCDYVTKAEISTDKFVDKDTFEEAIIQKANKEDIGAGIITLKVNKESIGTFNVNTNANKSLNISVATKLSELEQDVEIITEETLQPIKDELQVVKNELNEIPSQLTHLQRNIDTKVEKEPGMGLISKTEAERLSHVTQYDDTMLLEMMETQQREVQEAVSTITNKVDKEDGKGLSQNDYTDDAKALVEETARLADQLEVKVETINTKLATDIPTIKNSIQTVESNVNNLDTDLQNEKHKREQETIALQEQIAGLSVKPTVVDIVQYKSSLETYDTSTLKARDVICVLIDETQDNATSYYRWDGSVFFYAGSEGKAFTKQEVMDKFVAKTTLINGHPLANNVNLTYTDVNALPDNTFISDRKITITRNNTKVGEFTLNQEEESTIDIRVPIGTSELTNDAKFVDRNYFFTYIGEVPADDNLQDQVGRINDIDKAQDERMDLLEALIVGAETGLAKVAKTGRYEDLVEKPDLTDEVERVLHGSTYIDVPKGDARYVQLVNERTKVSELENDRGYVTNNAIGRGILTFKLQDKKLGEWMANEKYDNEIVIPLDTTLSTTSANPVQNKTITNSLNTKAVDSTVVHLTGTETITGTKTFNNISIVTGTSTTKATSDSSTAIATTAYVKNQDYCTNTNAVHKAQDETITGKKTFTGDVVLNNATGITKQANDNSTNLATTKFVKDQDYCTNTGAVHKTGEETINGNKTFAETTTFVGITNLGDYAHVGYPLQNEQGQYADDSVVNIQFMKDQGYATFTSLATEIANIRKDYLSITSASNTYVTQTTYNAKIKSIEDRLTALENRATNIETRLTALES